MDDGHHGELMNAVLRCVRFGLSVTQKLKMRFDLSEVEDGEEMEKRWRRDGGESTVP